MEFHHPFTRFEEVRDPLHGAVFVPYFSGFKSSEFPRYPEYLRSLLAVRRPGDRIALVITDAAHWRAAEIADLVRAAGGSVPLRVVDTAESV